MFRKKFALRECYQRTLYFFRIQNIASKSNQTRALTRNTENFMQIRQAQTDNEANYNNMTLCIYFKVKDFQHLPSPPGMRQVMYLNTFITVECSMSAR